MSRCKSKATKESDKGPPKELEMKEKLTKTELKKRKGKKNVWTEEGCMIPLNRKIEQHATWKIGFGSVVAVTVVLVAVVVLV
ncbi:hypothetical protein IFR04_002361 [Cadophora malorum]|uniref:Uncharacterized protein n=1 Tax=Cadophora malorum TaxID=108018 RepID=A0A8H7WGG7_9HELO|nr:hypothetical protein IFR04_002361 [Cadophora malorum]